ncbi:hypothetical protein MMC10_001765 [Thelotrema lepadinum]|nr:hypothetical protein [Thelotrema lepadinum]
MSISSQKRSSQHTRSPATASFEASDLEYSSPVPVTGAAHFPDQFPPPSPRDSAGEQYESRGFAAVEQHSPYLHSTYPPRKSSPNSLGSSIPQSDFLFSNHEVESGQMMSHRDLGYGYMPSPVPSYSASQPYGSTLAAMSGYYPDSRNLSGSSYLPNLGFRMTPADERDHIQRRRRRNSTEKRHQAKLQMRKNRLPSITGIGLEENQLSSSPVDLFTAAPSVHHQTYVPDSITRSFSRPSMSPLRDDFRQSGQHSYDLNHQSTQTSYQPQQSYQSQAPYQPSYTMTSLNPSTLAPPTLPTTSATFPPGRSSPMLQAPLPPAPLSISRHPEPVVVDRPPRDKPQCWDHGWKNQEAQRKPTVRAAGLNLRAQLPATAIWNTANASQEDRQLRIQQLATPACRDDLSVRLTTQLRRIKAMKSSTGRSSLPATKRETVYEPYVDIPRKRLNALRRS